MSQDTLDLARAGDPEAFGALTAPYSRELHLHCYRMLGSLADAEDMLQETLLAAWRGLAGFEGRSSLRAWLYSIATRRCLNALRGAGRRVPRAPVPPFEPPEPSRRGHVTWLQPYPDTLLDQVADTVPGPEARYRSREAVELAFIAALQRLPPRQTAVLVLRDVLGYSTVEVAEMLGTTGTAVKGALQRARAACAERGGSPSPAPPRERPGSVRESDLTRRFAEAFAADDVDAVVALLTDDAWLAMPPAAHEYHGAAAITSFLEAGAAWRAGRRFHLVPVRANTQPAFGCYLPDDSGLVAHPVGLIVLTLGQDRIQAVTRFLDDGLPVRFGLPERIPLPDRTR
ncbi:RNA polymerase subunit sigma-70 [Nocardiopsis lambiniae]|uniref:RNA polymerase subunit sigma-70 n=1 Tax=Nocardiopsis lambiniae TaxID=3075539 RepID=A0ABU2M2E3_9ACTN|nr:RNA polymerase subunit sigma-70 [Nocardiopsis sp. DSM 44743]MDT0326808.1 RNA polymerase subunit sigma-70 [Nocardiopsis sp. DSM 44743]